MQWFFRRHLECDQRVVLVRPLDTRPGGETIQVADQRAPRLGEHSAEVLADFGYTETQINELLRAGVIEVPASPAQ